MTKSITFGITGATGISLAFNLIEQLLKHNCKVDLVITAAGVITANQEMKINLSTNPRIIRSKLIEELNLDDNESFLNVYDNGNWYAPFASGTAANDAMVICPCSMATLGGIANGCGDDLLSRAADVMIKERKNLVIVPREVPLSTIHLANMHKLSLLGISILPPMIEFYNHPQTITHMLTSLVSKIMFQLGIVNTLVKPWSKDSS